MPSNRKNAGNSSVKCFRLVTADKSPIVDDDGAIIVPQADNDEKDDEFEAPGSYNLFQYVPARSPNTSFL